jgi:N6-adenosine-specific RNA methylase IME4
MKKYQIIYADPPWKYGNTGGSKWSPASNYYKVMSFEEIKALKETLIDKIIDNNSCLLFLWVVSAELPKCIEVAQHWGFKYITVAFVWYKNRANVGNYTMSGCELCLLFKKGTIPKDRVRNPGQKQFFAESVSKHSRKPAEIRRRIEAMYPKSKKIELFAREKHLKWDVWGDEVHGIETN